MSGLRSSQKAKFGAIITKYGLEPTDFEWREKPKRIFSSSEEPVEIFHKESEYYFKFEESTSSKGRSTMYLAYTPDTNSTKRALKAVSNWENLITYFDEWVGIIKEETEAVDPWSTPAESKTFQDKDTKFTELELKSVDHAIDQAFETLLKKAEESGQQKTLDSIANDITFLKEEARKRTRNKWLDLFKQVVAGMVLEWGLDAAVTSDVLRTLYETAQPVLTIVA